MRSYECEGVTIVEIDNKIDSQTAPALEELLGTLLEQGNYKIICDFAENEYVSSAGLRVFLSALKKAKRFGGEFALCGIKPGVLEVFDMVGFINLFEIYDGIEMALEKLCLSSVPIEKQQDLKKAKALTPGERDEAVESYSQIRTEGRKLSLDEKI